ncbi:MAG: DUF2079 domain-containing protein [Candidatus Rokuibacteriota bacterium]
MGYALMAVPLVGYVSFLSESLFARPNPAWALALLLWSLGAAAVAAWFISGKAAPAFTLLDDHAARVVIAMIGVAVVTAIAINIAQAEHFAMGMRSRDMAYYNQILWNTLRGHILEGNLNQEVLFRPPVFSDFALHVSPFLLVGILPIYALAPHFLTLLILRDVALAAAAWPLFLMARERFGGVAGVAAATLYLVNPVVMAQAFQEFTPLQLAPLPFFFALRGFMREQLGAFVTWTALAMSMREDVAVTMVGFGVWALLKRRQPRWVIPTLGLPLAWWGVSTLIVQPAFGRWGNNISEISLAGGEPARWGIYEILDPTRLVDVLSGGGLYYLYRLLRSVAFLPVTGLDGVLAAPVLAANLFYASMSHEGIDAISRLALLPSCALIGAAVLIAGRLSQAYRADKRMLVVLVLLLLPSASLVDGAKDSVQAGLTTYTLHNDAAALREAVKLIPGSASVAAPGYALPALANRAKLFNLPQLHMYPRAQADYILIDRDLDRVTTSPALQPRYVALLEDLAQSTEYETVWRDGEYALLRRVGHGQSK